MSSEVPSVAVIGGGAAGMMAAITADAAGADVTLFERNRYLGRKLGITGKGRCNLTNSCTREEFFDNVISNPRFLRSALGRFGPAELMDFFTERGVALKVERGNRVFPESDRAADIVNALLRSVTCKRVTARVTAVRVSGDKVTGIVADGVEYPCDRAIICTGGLSYPQTGSDGDGYLLARELGIEVTPTYPALTGIICAESFCAELTGLSLKNIRLSLLDRGGKTLYSDIGEMLFTHFGVSGPLVLTASSHIRDLTPGACRLSIDMKPGLDRAALDTRLLSDFSKFANRDFINSLDSLLPQAMIPVAAALSGIPPHLKVNSVTSAQRAGLVTLLKGLPLTVTGLRPTAEAIVTRGGISVSEINPSTMESRKIHGLYFAGEVIDVDALTGGFNLQIAFSTGHLAGEKAALPDKE